MFLELTASVSFNPCSACLPPTQVHYKKGHHERKAKYTSLADPPEVELAKKAEEQRSDVSEHIVSAQKYNNNAVHKGR